VREILEPTVPAAAEAAPAPAAPLPQDPADDLSEDELAARLAARLKEASS